MHRDYQSNMPIRLYQFDNFIEVMNAGGLYGEARPENFPNVNDYRNPLIAEAMRVMKYVNKFNRGITRVQEMLKENHSPAAKFDVSNITAFIASIFTPKSPSPNIQVEAKIADRIIAFCMEPKSATEIMKYLGFKNRTKFRSKYLNPLLGTKLKMTIPDKPTSRNQKYFAD